jgi:cellulose synthase/poly-beta-1,6-N-acetylglucosamine synthase-like glycosyltransferase
MTADVTVLAPIRHEDHLLEERLHHLLEASRSVRGRLLLAVDASAPASVAAARRFASAMPGAELHVTEAPGKFSAVRDALARVADGVVVLVDADVTVGAGSFTALVEPLLDGRADVCAARVHVAKPARDHASWRARVINAWEAINCHAWHVLRTTYRSSAWSLPGQLYATRVSMLPARIEVPTIDDGCIGLHLRASDAVFAYVPSAAVWHPAPRTYFAWLRQKFRYRRGWARLAQVDPAAVADLERNLGESLRAATHGTRLAGGSLRAQFAAMRLAARVADVVAPVRRPDWRQAR